VLERFLIQQVLWSQRAWTFCTYLFKQVCFHCFGYLTAAVMS